MYYTYILRCEDKSLYTGIARSVSNRLREHREKDPRGAKYTRSRNITGVEAVFVSDDRSKATKLECAIKRLRKEKKEKLICCPKLFSEILPHLPAEDYRAFTKEEIENI